MGRRNHAIPAREMNDSERSCYEQASYSWSEPQPPTGTASSWMEPSECPSPGTGEPSPSSDFPFLIWSGQARNEWPLLSLARARCQLPSSSTWIAQMFGISQRTARRWKTRLIGEKLLHQRGETLYPTLTFEQKPSRTVCVPLCFVLRRCLTPKRALALAEQRGEQRGREAYGRYWIRSDSERAVRVGLGRNTMRRARRQALSRNLIRIRYHRRGKAWNLTTAHVDERWIWGAKPGESFRRKGGSASTMTQSRKRKALTRGGQKGSTTEYPSVGPINFHKPAIELEEERTVPRRWVEGLVEKLRVQSSPYKLPPIDKAKVRADLARPELTALARLAADGHARAIWQILKAAGVYAANKESFNWLLRSLTRHKANPLKILQHCQRVWNTDERCPPIIIQKNLDRVAVRGLCSVIKPPKPKKETKPA